MNKSRAEALLQCRVETERLSTHRQGWKARAYWGDAESLVTRGRGGTEAMALRELVERVYRARCHMVFQGQDFKCYYCGGKRPLQGHHVTFRSHGGTHTEENLRGACAECHEKVHRGRMG